MQKEDRERFWKCNCYYLLRFSNHFSSSNNTRALDKRIAGGRIFNSVQFNPTNVDSLYPLEINSSVIFFLE
jgi:hypothetical protein